MTLDLAFVLVRTPQLPDPDAVIATAHTLGIAIEKAAIADNVLTLELAGTLPVLVSSMPAPHPDAPRMLGARTSPKSDAVATARAHFIIVPTGTLPGTAWQRDTQLAKITAAVAANVDAVAAMLGSGRSFHRSDIFVKFAQLSAESGELWDAELAIDIATARESETRMAFLSHGMVRYGREEFLITCPIQGAGARDFMMTMVRWMLDEPDKQLPTGDTVGRTADEKVRVRRVPNPMTKGPDVIRLDLP